MNRQEELGGKGAVTGAAPAISSLSESQGSNILVSDDKVITSSNEGNRSWLTHRHSLAAPGPMDHRADHLPRGEGRIKHTLLCAQGMVTQECSTPLPPPTITFLFARYGQLLGKTDLASTHLLTAMWQLHLYKLPALEET